MKKIECMIPPAKFPELEKTLRHHGVHGLTVYDVRGFGNEQTRPESFLYLPKTKLELFCHDDQVEHLIQLISEACRTGRLGDGKIFVTDVDQIVRIRTGERGTVAV